MISTPEKQTYINTLQTLWNESGKSFELEVLLMFQFFSRICHYFGKNGAVMHSFDVLPGFFLQVCESGLLEIRETFAVPVVDEFLARQEL